MTCQAGYTSKGYRCMKNITSTPLNFSNLVAKERTYLLSLGYFSYEKTRRQRQRFQ